MGNQIIVGVDSGTAAAPVGLYSFLFFDLAGELSPYCLSSFLFAWEGSSRGLY